MTFDKYLEEIEEEESKLNWEKVYNSAKDVLKRKENLILAGSAIAAHCIGDLLGFYNDISQYDTFTHVLSASAIGKGVNDFLDEGKIPQYKKYIPCFVLGLGLGWEGYETVGGIEKSLGDKDMGFWNAMANTLKDLGSNLVGADIGTGGNLIDSIYHSGLEAMVKIDNIKYNIFGF